MNAGIIRVVLDPRSRSFGQKAFRNYRICIALVAGSLIATTSMGISAQESCGSLQNAYGPYDYTNPTLREERLPIVEGAHLTMDVIQLRKGATATSPLPDIDYTLRAFPNHPIALDAMARLHRQAGVEKFSNGRYSLRCWFERAERMNPSDSMVSLIYGVHLFQVQRYDEAEERLLHAIQLAPGSAEAHYNLGLLYFRLERFDESVEHARVAYDLGFPLPGLRNLLSRSGHWPATE